jgi:hypothetical protein
MIAIHQHLCCLAFLKFLCVQSPIAPNHLHISPPPAIKCFTLHAHRETFLLLKEKQPSCCSHTAHDKGYPTSRREHLQALFLRRTRFRRTPPPPHCDNCPLKGKLYVHRENFFSCSKKSNPSAAATLPMAGALQRAVGSTYRRFF